MGGGGGGAPAKYARRSNSPGRGRGRGRGGRGRGKGRGRGRGDKGRNRYTRDGIKKRTSASADDESSRQEELWPLPPLTVPNGLRPSFYTCRHTYESTLMDEIERYVSKRKDLAGHAFDHAALLTSSPYPGLVRVEDDTSLLPESYDSVYALQCMPECVIVTGESIKGIAREVLHALLGDSSQNTNEENDAYTIIDAKSEIQRQKLYKAPRGSLSIHPLVPGMCKGQTNPIMLHRSTKIAEEMLKMLKKSYPAARKAGIGEDGDAIQPEEKWIMQIMLQSPNIAVASLTQCRHIGPGSKAYWPNALHPLGLAKVDITERMPSSAYRKLMEGIECMGVRPTPSTTVVDLGACPGGWTSVIRRYFDYCKVIAVDRSEVDAVLMKDNMVEFVQGDAFTFEPPQSRNCWMISDVIAYPERTTEMLNTWCANRWASVMIVTMKFQGVEPDLNELERAIHVVKSYGYGCRVKHFFNNKNEVTFMVWSLEETKEGRVDLENVVVGGYMYPSL